MDQAWLEAARSYNAMDEGGRYAYWSQLTPEQQDALTEALAALAAMAATSAANQPSAVPVTSVEAPRRRSGFGLFAMGCGGVILGVILTLAVEAAVLAKGLSELGEMFSSSTPSTQSHPTYEPSEPTPEPMPEPTPSQERSRRDDRRFDERKEEWESNHPGEAYPCEVPATE